MRQSISAFSRRILDAIVNGCICAIANLQGTRSTLPQGRTIGPACRVVPWLLVLLPPTFGHAQLHDKAEFFQTCDASAGISLDERLFAVASDEDNWIRIYDYKSPGNPTQLVNFSSLVGISTDEEADVEAATQIGDVTYWITSHGTNSHGERKSSRQILFALRFAVLQNKIEYSIVGVPYRQLLDDLAREPKLAQYNFGAASKIEPKKPGGLNIEGLCAFNNQLFIGFRNPIPGGKALIVPIVNAQALVDSAHGDSVHAKFGDSIELDLHDRGVRSIEYDESSKAFWIIAGRFDRERDFALYRWKGPGGGLEQIDLNFGKWNPEALIVWPNRPFHLQILSDDGERTLEDVDEHAECKDLPLSTRRFRSGWVKIDH